MVLRAGCSVSGVGPFCCCGVHPVFFVDVDVAEYAEVGEQPTHRDRRAPLPRLGVFGAEPWTEGMREEIEAELGIDALDIYGLSEVMGPGVASECVETKDGPHVWEDHFYPEVLDPVDGTALDDGCTGELAFTSLTKQALPIIRYRTRDLTRLLPGTARPAMRRMEKVSGRSDDMIILRGVNLFPSQVEELVLQAEGLSPHFQLELTREDRMDRLAIHVEARTGTTTEQRDGAPALLAAAMKEAVGSAPRSRSWSRTPCSARSASSSASSTTGVEARGTEVAAAGGDLARLVVMTDRTLGRSTNRGRPGYDLETLLHTAVKVFHERGYDGTSMEDLAKRLGISKSAIYYHVSSKEELLRVRGNSKVERKALARRRELDHVVGALVVEAEEESSIRPDVQPAVTSRLLFGMVNSLIEWYRPQRGLDKEEIADAVVKIAFDGLRR